MIPNVSKGGPLLSTHLCFLVTREAQLRRPTATSGPTWNGRRHHFLLLLLLFSPGVVGGHPKLERVGL